MKTLSVLLAIFVQCWRPSLSQSTEGDYDSLSSVEQLNCPFATNFCQWSGVALPPENANRWKLRTTNAPSALTLAPMTPDYIFSEFGSRSGSCSLISGMLAPTSTSFTLSFQVVQAGEARLTVCRRQRPQSTGRTRFSDCQAVNSPVRNEWFTHSMTFSPTEIPTQLLIRAFGSTNDDFLALRELHVNANARFRRGDRDGNNVTIITYENWQRARDGDKSIYINPRVTLVVSDKTEASAEAPAVSTTTTQLPTTSTTKVTSTTGAPSTTECVETFCVEKESSEEQSENSENIALSKDGSSVLVTTATKKPPPTSTTEDPKQVLSNLAQWVQILRNVAPVLPMIPSLINSFKQGDSPPTSSATDSLNSIAHSYPATGEQLFSWKPQGDARRAPLPTPISPIPASLKLLDNSRESVRTLTTTKKPTTDFTSFGGDFDLSSLTVDELKTLESIHQKIFPIGTPTTTTAKPVVRKVTRINSRFKEAKRPVQKLRSATTTASPVIVFNKAKAGEGDANGKFRYLTPQMLQELNMVANLPDIESLSEGLDLSLLNKPGGFAKLKQQFMERLLTRMPAIAEDSDLLRAANSYRY